ncbi:MAG TPA: CRISPR-associated endonuclease Cas3'' [Candidatus Bathyarchaeia archaeon]|nr:CRISPR-associated endonuclease Cas3'' [Candidatus Bathyarchaeia archaeon]
MNFLARSKGQGHDQQTYVDHVLGTLKFMKRFAGEAIPYAEHLPQDLLFHTLYNAVLFHDLGKLDSLNQEALKGGPKKKLRVFHEDAGAAYWLTDETPCFVAAVLIYSHHKGLTNFPVESARGETAFRFTDTERKKGFLHTKNNLDKYIQRHLEVLKNIKITVPDLPIPTNALDWRILLSFIVDSDHSNAANHCSQYFDYVLPDKARWAERLQKLDEKISAKADEPCSKKERKRNLLRTKMYECCRNSGVKERIVQCEAPVGSGKTSAVLAYLLNQAVQVKDVPRRLFVVVPFTSLICQIIDDLRDWIVLDGENPEEVVVGHYHMAEYSSDRAKHLSVLWRARIIVTTSVQFFETLASSRTASLRKLHALPGSMVFIDEFHATLPLKLWPVAWLWIKALAENWGCRFALSSGSMAEVWNISETNTQTIPSLISSEISDELFALEKNRIKYEPFKKPLDIIGLSDAIKSKGPWPKMVIMNTVQNAAILARHLKDNEALDVIHLSTALTPKHRKLVVEKIKERLKNTNDTQWILVATSCVEAGMNFSFRTGFREAFSVSSTLQPAGRINRHFSEDDAVLYVFTTTGSAFNKHPAADTFSLFKCFDENWFEKKNPSELMHSAMMSQWNRVDRNLLEQMLRDERNRNFEIINQNFRVIEADTRTVLISDSIREEIENYGKVSWQEIQKNSVQLWGTKIAKLALQEIRDTGIYYINEDLYDAELLGIMKFILGIEDFLRDGGAVI